MQIQGLAFKVRTRFAIRILISLTTCTNSNQSNNLPATLFTQRTCKKWNACRAQLVKLLVELVLC